MSGSGIPWLQPFRAAISAEAGRPTVLALATVDEAGDAQVRSMICRRTDEFGRIWMTADSRSAKHQQILRHPRAAAVAWFPSSRQQFRFSGSIEILDGSSGDSQWLDLWRSLSSETRATFFWPVPGQPRAAVDRSLPRSSEAAQPPACFAVLVMIPIVVECLSMTFHPHQRVRWEHERGWRAEQLNP
jgi:pyridoxamine 5'-phosphate oxidase